MQFLLFCLSATILAGAVLLGLVSYLLWDDVRETWERKHKK